MGRALQALVAEHAPDRSEERRAERRAFETRMREQARLSEARKLAAEKAVKVTGRVIFPARWSAERMHEYGDAIRCTVRWEGLRLTFEHFRDHRDSSSRFWAAAPGKKRLIVGTPSELAAALELWAQEDAKGGGS